MNRRNLLARCLLMPFALIYNIIIRTRNSMFDYGLLPSVAFTVPVISIGNLSAGGTGKTPFTEYLVALLKQKYRVAVLSRGYKRHTTGFVLVEKESTSIDVGDEPYQIKHKFPDVIVAVDANRRRGIKRLLEQPDMRPDVILLDDAMQHRYVSPSLMIMLTACDNLYYEDRLLPVGNLRESAKGARRADMIIVTKCQQVLKPIDLRIMEKNMSLRAYQNLYFSIIKYQDVKALFPKQTASKSNSVQKNTTDDNALAMETFIANKDILLITGIAQPKLFIDKVKACSPRNVYTCIYRDHHEFTQDDIMEIDDLFQQMPTDNRLILCTEKDAARLKAPDILPDTLKPYLYYVPIVMDFLFGRGEQLNARIQQHILSTINLNKKNGKN